MRKVTCKDCGRRYDYDVDDFCPKCGSYNPPDDPGSTQLERELLSRFETGRSRQNAANPAPVRDSRPAGAAQEERGRRHSARIEDCASCVPKTMVRPPLEGAGPMQYRRRPVQKGSNPGKIILIVVGVLFLINFLLPLAAGLLWTLC